MEAAINSWEFNPREILLSPRKVKGIFHKPMIDKDGEFITADAIRKSIPDYMHLPALHDFHKERPVGIATKIYELSGGKFFFEGVIKATADCDDIWQKISSGNYDQVSIFGKRTAYNSNCNLPQNMRSGPCITDGVRLDSISVCDENARNPQTSLEVQKAKVLFDAQTIIKAEDSNSSLMHASTDYAGKKVRVSVKKCPACKREEPNTISKEDDDVTDDVEKGKNLDSMGRNYKPPTITEEPIPPKKRKEGQKVGIRQARPGDKRVEKAKEEDMEKAEEEPVEKSRTDDEYDENENERTGGKTGEARKKKDKEFEVDKADVKKAEEGPVEKAEEEVEPVEKAEDEPEEPKKQKKGKPSEAEEEEEDEEEEEEVEKGQYDREPKSYLHGKSTHQYNKDTLKEGGSAKHSQAMGKITRTLRANVKTHTATHAQNKDDAAAGLKNMTKAGEQMDENETDVEYVTKALVPIEEIDTIVKARTEEISKAYMGQLDEIKKAYDAKFVELSSKLEKMEQETIRKGTNPVIIPELLRMSGEAATSNADAIARMQAGRT